MPLIVRRIFGDARRDYEMLSGHNRMNAGKLDSGAYSMTVRPRLMASPTLTVSGMAVLNTRISSRKACSHYDYIIIDTNRAASPLMTNALTAADSVLIPLCPEFYSTEGHFAIILLCGPPVRGL